MIDDKTEDSPKILLAAGGERGVIRILDINRKSQHTAVRKYKKFLKKKTLILSAFTNWCH
jgi:hypothetical protein